ncbi:ATP-dependent DNA ligase [Amnibacterium sp. CER49]|uniref:DUF7882 family protein n=1 Tax=Amnibacterium sp. CER49 TaxID=3039161 RepID=UPI00244D2FEC|nr:ATP-dependent DNA ligase [Amnibacterium sp. CER49]MDH2443355.1 ATP-dependent DNA ligase [Amnibacterium sp. CER49]
MGTLLYDGAALDIEDRLLTHLQIVVVQKFRRGESFLMTWLSAADADEGRGSLWLTPGSPVYFRFTGSRVPSVNEEWLQRLAASAAGSTGLIVTGEDGHTVLLPGVRTVRTHPAWSTR